MNQIESLIFLLGVAALLALLAQKVRVPYPVFLVLGGLGIGFVPGFPEVEIPPEVIFLVFLPPLLNASAFFSSPLELRHHFTPILMLAIGLVLLTAAAIAVVAHTIVGLPWAAAFVLGAILAPTDPVAAEAVFRRLGVPARVRTVVGGESLINDGSALAAYWVAIVAVVVSHLLGYLGHARFARTHPRALGRSAAPGLKRAGRHPSGVERTSQGGPSSPQQARATVYGRPPGLAGCSAADGMRDDYEERVRRYASGLEAGGTTEEYAESSAAWRNWRRELLIAERETIATMRDQGEITPEVMRRIMRDLDLEESRIVR